MNSNEDYKSVWAAILDKCHAAVQKGTLFYPQIETYLSDTELSRAEFSLGSRYLPRGYYCPSPDIECIITNMHRGRIAKRVTKSTRTTNFYMFNKDNKLFLAETFYPNGATTTEYILHEENVSYGFIYNKEGRIISINVEAYADGKLVNYLWASCIYKEATGYEFSWIINEDFRYLNQRQLETDFYNVQILMERICISRWKAAFDLDENEKIITKSRIPLSFKEEQLKV